MPVSPDAESEEAASTDVAASTAASEAVDAATNHHHRLFWCVLTAVSIGGMGVATFCVLAGGKVGFALMEAVFEIATYGAVDGAVDLNVAMQRDSASVLSVLPDLLKRGAAWFAIAILLGSTRALNFIPFDAKREGTVWQPEPIIFRSIADLICMIGLIGMVMMRAHSDRQPNAMKWFVLLISLQFLALSGTCTPYPLISALASVLQLLVTTFGAYFLLMKLDHEAIQSNVRRGYKLLACIGLSGVLYFSLYITILESFLGSFAISGALVMFQNVCLQIVIPVCKHCFGADEKKLWSYPLPAFVLALELVPCLLLLGSDVASVEFWGLLVM